MLADNSVCVFPAVAQHGTNDTWRRVSRDPLYTRPHRSSRWRITGSKITIEHGSSSYEYADRGGYQLDCFQNVAPDKTLVKRVEAGQPMTYACVRFIKRSEVVLQVEFSKYVSSPDVSLCKESNLFGNGTTLVQYDSSRSAWSSILSRIPYIKCSLEGGYIVKSWQDEYGTEYKHAQSDLRLEGECGHGTGITLSGSTDDFPFPLQGVLLEDDSLMCLATWSSGRYTFSVVVDDLPSAFMCMRTPADPQVEFTVEFFIDGLCDDRNDIAFSTEYRVLNVQQYVVQDLCSNRSPTCASSVDPAACSEEDARRCPDTCRTCPNPLPWESSTLPSNLQGRWFRETSLLGEGHMDISARRVTFTHLGSWSFLGDSTCKRKQYGMQSNGTEYMLAASSSNGCLPRVSTAVIIPFSPAVLGVQVSQSAPANLDIVADTRKWTEDKSSWCQGTFYGEHRENMGDRYHVGSFAWYNFVKEDKDVPLSKCNLNRYGKFSIEFYKGTTCSATLQQRPSGNAFDMTIKWCTEKDAKIPGGLKTAVEHQCLAYFKGKSWNTYILTRTPAPGVNVVNRTYVCWWLSDDEPLGYLMRVGECHEETSSEVKAGIKRPLATLRFIDPGPEPGAQPSPEPGEVEVVVGDTASSQHHILPALPLSTLVVAALLHITLAMSLW